jgi:uncharacterized protein
MSTQIRIQRALALGAVLISSLFLANIEVRAADAAEELEAIRPQTPQAPFPYRVEDVRFPGGRVDVSLAGSLTVPHSLRRLPAVVLVHGSGPADRDVSVNGHKLFLVMSDALTRAGYVVLRYDKRGVAQSSGDGRAATTLDLADDAAAAIAYLRDRPEIDSRRIAIIGHSEGGSIAALLSGGPRPPAACVSISGLITPFTEQMPLQEILTGADFGADSSYAYAIERYYVLVNTNLSSDDDHERLKRMTELSTQWQSEFPPGHPNHDAATASLLQLPKLLASNWFKTLMHLDVTPAIRRGNGPMLFLNGSTDRQVVAENNLSAASTALGPQTRLRHTRVLHGVNHMLQDSDTGSSAEYHQISQTLSPTVLPAVISFLDTAMSIPESE